MLFSRFFQMFRSSDNSPQASGKQSTIELILMAEAPPMFIMRSMINLKPQTKKGDMSPDTSPNILTKTKLTTKKTNLIFIY